MNSGQSQHIPRVIVPWNAIGYSPRPFVIPLNLPFRFRNLAMLPGQEAEGCVSWLATELGIAPPNLRSREA